MTKHFSPACHKWTYEEDLLCCRKYWEYLLRTARNRNFDNMLGQIKTFFPTIEHDALKHRLTKVRELAIDYNFYDGMEDMGFHRRCDSLQLNRAFLQVMHDMGIEEEIKGKCPSLVIDTVEFTDEYKKIIPELEKLLEDTNKRWRGIGACHMIWAVKEDILREKFNILWQCPSALNPRVLFD